MPEDSMIASAAERRWREAVLVDVRPLRGGVCDVVLDVSEWPGHLAGQHLDVRLRGSRGWSKTHSYSIANVPGAAMEPSTWVHLAVQEDSIEGIRPGDVVEVDGPKGLRMAWTPEQTGDRPLLLIGGGTGIVPLMAIACTWAAQPQRVPLRIIHSVRSRRAQIYDDEMAVLAFELGAGVVSVSTGDDSAPRLSGQGGRLTPRDLELFGFAPKDEPECFVCGSESFVESVVGMLVQAGHARSRIRTEWDVRVLGAVA
jgi:ferredoxin-NADP reductase